MLLPLKIDVDSLKPLPVWVLVERAFKANRRIVCLAQERSPSGKGWHLWVWVEPEPKTAVEVVALQLLFGSDPNREAYNLNRARLVDSGVVSDYWRERWNVLYGEVEK